jgi:hypothetical protein
MIKNVINMLQIGYDFRFSDLVFSVAAEIWTVLAILYSYNH